MNTKVGKDAYDYILKNKKSLISFFIKEKNTKKKSAFFMAGSPGAGKTEFVKSLVKIFNKIDIYPVVIDADRIRTEFLSDFYTPTDVGKGISGNAYELQSACIKGVNILIDRCLKRGFFFILDGTMGGKIETQKENIDRCLNRGIEIAIFYLHQDPKLAWKFTKKREIEEGRNIKKDVFIKQFLGNKENINKLKKSYPNINLNLVEKDFKHKIVNFKINPDNIDYFIKKVYTKDDLEKILC